MINKNSKFVKMEQSNVNFGMNEISIINEEETRRQFENSVASLADVNKIKKKDKFESRRGIKSQNDKRENNLITEKNIVYPNNLQKEIGFDHIRNISPNENNYFSSRNISLNKSQNSSNGAIEINYLTPAILKDSKKFSHIKNGKINPPKSNFSLKPETERKIKEHEENIKDFILITSKVEIENSYKTRSNRFEDYPNTKNNDQNQENLDEIKNQHEENNFYDYNRNFEKTQNMMVIDENFSEKLNSSISKNKLFNTNKKFYPNQTQHPEGHSNSENYKEGSSKERRNIIRKYEKFYSNTKDFFVSNDQKVPSRCNFEEIINNIEDLKTSIEKFKIENSNSREKINYQKNIVRNTNSYLLKDSIIKNKQTKFIKTERSYNPLNIDPEQRKKIEEKIEMLHLEIRNTMDNINKFEDKDEKLNELLNKSQSLSEILKNFSYRIKFDNSLNSTVKKKNELEINRSLTKNKKKEFENIVKKEETEAIKNQNEVDEVLDVLKGNRDSLSNYYIPSPTKTNIPITIPKNFNTDENFMRTQPFQNNPNNSYNNLTGNYDGMSSINMKDPNIYNNNIKNKSALSNVDRVNMGQSMMYQSQSGIPNNDISNNILRETNMFDILNNSQSKVDTYTNYGNKFNNSQHLDSKSDFNNSLFRFTSQNLKNHPIENLPYNHQNFENFRKSHVQNREINFNDQNSFNPNFIKTENKNNNISLTESKRLNELNSSNRGEEFVPMPKIETQNIRNDDRLTAYNIEFPVDYYHKLSKKNQPKTEKDWYIRPHHTESFAKSKRAIPDDVMNTKYISYYAPSEYPPQEKKMEEHLSEIIENLENKIENLKFELFKKSNGDKEFKHIYKKMQRIKEDVDKEHNPDMYFKGNKQGINSSADIYKNRNSNINLGHVLSVPAKSERISYSELFDKNEGILRKNIVIGSYETLLEELRNKEKEILLMKREEEFEKMRPPVDKWWEIRSNHFREEMHRNKVVLNAPQTYFKKLKELKREDLF